MKRSSGILLHISSLPDQYGIGSMGPEAYAFVDFLHETCQQLWQILPLGPTGYGNSPYQSFSIFAGNILLISIEKLIEEELLSPGDLNKVPLMPRGKVQYDLALSLKDNLLRKAYKTFIHDFDQWKEPYLRFEDEHAWWLNDYALYMAIKSTDEKLCWNQWDIKIKNRNRHGMDVAVKEHSEEIAFHKFAQFIFFRQWFQLKNYANKKSIRIIGDIPLYVSLDSSDVWSNQDIFMLDHEGTMTLTGGVPPDYFSETGQHWGCPVFNWKRLEERQYDWWVARIHFNLRMFDLVRIDHFRGLESFWAIPSGEKTAIKGEWLPAKGFELLSLLKSQLWELPIIAEDLGIITPEVEKLRTYFGLPGMKVLHFAFASDQTNSHLPHNYETDFIVYTGTHDNNTTIGWLKTSTKNERRNIRKYFGAGWRHMHLNLIEAAWASVAAMAIIPMQDILEIGARGRMNTPGTVKNNWEWRFNWNMLHSRQKRFLKNLTKKYNRAANN